MARIPYAPPRARLPTPPWPGSVIRPRRSVPGMSLHPSTPNGVVNPLAIANRLSRRSRSQHQVSWFRTLGRGRITDPGHGNGACPGRTPSPAITSPLFVKREGGAELVDLHYRLVGTERFLRRDVQHFSGKGNAATQSLHGNMPGPDLVRLFGGVRSRLTQQFAEKSRVPWLGRPLNSIDLSKKEPFLA
jgi:hypothetical protein